MKSYLLPLSLTALASLLASCSSTPSCGNSHPYLANRPVAPLQAPAGVTLPKPDAAYAIPAAGTKAAAVPSAVTSNGPCLVRPPSVLTKEDMSRAPTTLPKPSEHPGAAPPPAHLPPPPPVAAKGAME